MHRWQKDLWAALAGSDPKEMKIIVGGQNVGKSYLSQYWRMRETYYDILNQALVDDGQWFTVKCSEDISSWVRTQPQGMWHEHIDKRWMMYKNTFDIHEKIYTLMQLKYSDKNE